MRSSCTACRRTGAKKSRWMCSSRPRPSCSIRPKTGCTCQKALLLMLLGSPSSTAVTAERPPAPWLAHYDAGVPHYAGAVSPPTLIDYLADSARERPGSSRPCSSRAPTVTWRRAARDERRVRGGVCGARSSARRPRRAIAAQLPAVFHRPVRRVEDRRDRRSAQSDVYGEEIEGPLREHGIETIVTLTRFYARVKPLQGRTPLRRIIATNIKDYFPPLLRWLFTLARETARRRSRDASPPATTTSCACCARMRRASRRRADHAGRSRRPAHERRHDRHTQGRARQSRAHTWSPASRKKRGPSRR